MRKSEASFLKEFRALSPVEAKKRFRCLLKQVHPDRNGNTDKCRELVNAYRQSEIRPIVQGRMAVRWKQQWWRVIRKMTKDGQPGYLVTRGLKRGKYFVGVVEVSEKTHSHHVLLHRRDWERIQKLL